MRHLATLLLCALGLLPARALAAQDSVRFVRADTTPRVVAIDVSPWHARRLTIHRVTAYAVPVLFAAQYALGQRLYDGLEDPDGPDDWVRPAHRTGAVLIGTAFAVNATTGIMNLWAERAEPEGRTARLLHGTSMLVAAGGFAYAGIRLADQAQFSLEKRQEHRRVAIASMGLTLVSGTAMWMANR